MEAERERFARRAAPGRALIETLRIEGLAIVEEAQLDFGPGLNVITGETGAGKSIVLGALSLLAGGRAAARTLREEQGEARVEAIFRTESLPELEALLEERELSGPDHELVVARSFAGGRSRARVSGQLVPVGTLGELFAGRLEISSQHDSQALRRSEAHGRLLDLKGGLLKLRASLAEGYRDLRGLREEIVGLRERARERVQRQDFLAHQVSEIDDANLVPQEMVELVATRSRLAHAGKLREEGAEALARLVADPSMEAGGAATDALAEAARRLLALEDFDAELAAVGGRLAACAAEAQEAASDLERHLDGIEADPGRLESLEARLHRIEALQRKYGEDVSAVLCHREAAAAELESLEGADARIDELLGEEKRAAQALGKLARKLSRARARSAEALAQEVESALRELDMPHARFAVELRAEAPPEGLPSGPRGLEVPEFLFCANRGEAPRRLRDVASGGELSRAFLALKQALREQSAGMVLVFDEVDAGVGGEAADRVGRCLAGLAAHHQVLCITHLPQIAAWAETHFRVVKQQRKRGTRARVERVEGAERVEELARMAGGARPGKAAREFVRELLARSGRAAAR